jgi:hypothetical protein
MLFIVSQEPKKKERAGLIVFVMIVEAKTKAEALRKADDKLSKETYFCKPQVAPLEIGRDYRL